MESNIWINPILAKDRGPLFHTQFMERALVDNFANDIFSKQGGKMIPKKVHIWLFSFQLFAK